MRLVILLTMSFCSQPRGGNVMRHRHGGLRAGGRGEARRASRARGSARTRDLPHLWPSGTIWVSGSPPAELSFAEPLFGNDNIPDGGHRQIKFIPANVE